MRKFLKIYFWIYTVLALLGIITLLGREHSVFEILRNSVFWAFSPICIFLYVNEKKWLGCTTAAASDFCRYIP